MTKRRPQKLEGTTDMRPAGIPGTEVGWLVEGSTPGALLVDYPANTLGPTAARTTIPIDAAALERAVRNRQGVVLQFEGCRPDLPIITGLIRPPESPLVELLLETSATVEPALKGASRPQNQEVPATQPASLEARLDRKRVTLEAETEIVLRCGDASITLTRDGKVLVRGAYVETRSRGVNRIKGGAVKIN